MVNINLKATMRQSITLVAQAKLRCRPRTVSPKALQSYIFFVELQHFSRPDAKIFISEVVPVPLGQTDPLSATIFFID